MKNNALFLIVGISVLGIIFSPVAFGVSMVDSPKKQMAMGTYAKDVICNPGLALLIKQSASSAACVKPSTAEKLSGLGWGIIEKDVSMMDIARELVSSESQEIPVPDVVRSTNGKLDITLVAAAASIMIYGENYNSNVYNGSYVPPVIRVQRGDDVNITFINNMSPTNTKTGGLANVTGPINSNIHYHGMVISPQEPADNVYIQVPSSNNQNPTPVSKHNFDFACQLPVDNPSCQKKDSAYNYNWTVPANHPEGLNWYHPHVHGYVSPQIESGMSGMLVVEGLIEKHYPALADSKTKTFLLKSTPTKNINGMVGGHIESLPGDLEVFEIGNVGANSFFKFAIEDHDFLVLEHDGNVNEIPELVDGVFLPPGARAVVAVHITEKVGKYNITSDAIPTVKSFDSNPKITLGILIVKGDPVDSSKLVSDITYGASQISDIHPRVKDLQNAKITGTKTIIYSAGNDINGNFAFMLNGSSFEANPLHVNVTLGNPGEAEKWTLINNSTETHTFHIHQLDFLVTEIDGEDPDYKGLRDVIDIPPMGETKLIIPFDDPIMVGTFVFHCHIVAHEDMGMMAMITVNKPQ